MFGEAIVLGSEVEAAHELIILQYMYVPRVAPYCPRGTLTGVKALKRRCQMANVIPNGEDKWMRDVGSGGQVAPRRVSTGQQGRRRPEDEVSWSPGNGSHGETCSAATRRDE